MSKFIVEASTDVATLLLCSLDNASAVIDSIAITTGGDAYFIAHIYVDEKPTEEALRYVLSESSDCPANRIHGILAVQNSQVAFVEKEWRTHPRALSEREVLQIPNGTYSVVIYAVDGESLEENKFEDYTAHVRETVIAEIGEARFFNANKVKNQPIGCLFFMLLTLIAVGVIIFSSLCYKFSLIIVTILGGLLLFSGYLFIRDKWRGAVVKQDVALLLATEMALDQEYFPQYIIEMQSIPDKSPSMSIAE